MKLHYNIPRTREQGIRTQAQRHQPAMHAGKRTRPPKCPRQNLSAKRSTYRVTAVAMAVARSTAVVEPVANISRAVAARRGGLADDLGAAAATKPTLPSGEELLSMDALQDESRRDKDRRWADGNNRDDGADGHDGHNRTQSETMV
ncbi:hypothetical protein HMN09_01106600 [Mycena chlorophos]|uniref:Uncharacterized protein n=1 Tax=Mycena chlorophos TaxID=658473 RepID=A0A8H6SEI2_MYCCL|nr:hypothetical protein HMN09_01106600 [Mycena chlorophos]